MAIQRTRPCPFEQSATNLSISSGTSGGIFTFENSSPNAVNDIYFTNYRTPIIVENFLLNDNLPQGSETTVVSLLPRQEYGTIQFTGPSGDFSSFLFTPNENITGSCFFEYIIRDNSNNQSLGIIQVEVGQPISSPPPAPLPVVPPSPTAPQPKTIFSNITDQYINNSEIALLDFPQNLKRVEYYVFKNDSIKNSNKLIGPILTNKPQQSFKVKFDILAEDSKILNNRIYIKADLFDNSNKLIKTILKGYKLINKLEADRQEVSRLSPTELTAEDARERNARFGTTSGGSNQSSNNGRRTNDGRRGQG